MSDAGVGSIAHILKTAFKDVFEDDRKRDLASKARIEKVEREAKAAKDALLAAEAKALEEEAKKSETKKPADKKSSDKKGKAEPIPEPPKEVEPEPIVESDVEPVDPKSLIENYYAPIELLSLQDPYKEMLSTHTSVVREDFKIKERDAQELGLYLKDQIQQAKQMGIEEIEELKKQGIMIGQHIPSLPTKLDIRKQYMEGYGVYSSNLVIAKELVTDNYDQMLRRTGNLAISELTEKRIFERQNKRQVTMDAKEPHYMQKNHTTNLREDAELTRFDATLQESRLRRTTKDLTRNPRKRFPARKDLLSIEVKMGNEEVLKRLSHKLNYLRNPRNNPKGVLRMLTKPLSAFDAHGQPVIPEADDDSGSANRDDISKASRGSKSGKESKPKKLFEKFAPVTTNPLFVADPPSLEFNGYEVDQTFTQQIVFRNVSAVSRSIRIIPPGSTNFSIAPLKYPAHCNNGLIAPGMSALTVVTFIADSLGDFDDCLMVETEGGRFSVPVIAQRESPDLTIPSELDVGVCLLGDACRAVVTCTNKGGAGKFRLLKPEFYPEVPLDLDWAHMGCVCMEPFTVYPAEFTLRRNESVDITIEFVPRHLGEHSGTFFLLCDNAQVREFHYTGSCRLVDVTAVEVNGVEIDDTDPALCRDFFFQDVTIGNEQIQRLSVANDTGRPIEFEWVWVDLTVPEDDIRLEAMKIIEEKERQEEAVEAAAARTSLAADMFASPAAKPYGGMSYGDAVNQKPGGDETEPSQELIDNLMMTFEGTATPQNVVVDRDVSLMPARGVLVTDGLQEFDILFKPSKQTTFSARAVLVLKNIPHASTPSSSYQAYYKELLEHEAHGKFHRLRSWIEELGEVATVLPYKKPCGDMTTRGKITDLLTLLEMPKKYTTQQVSEEEKQRVENWGKKILLHAYACRNKILEIDDGDDEDQPKPYVRAEQSSKIGKRMSVNLYDWNRSPDENPQLLFPLILSTIPSRKDMSKSEDELRDEEALCARSRHLLREIWIDAFSAVQLFGNEICEELDEKVKHEAVDYIQEISRTSVVCLQTLVKGNGVCQRLTVSPPLLRVGGVLSIGSVWSGKFQIRNPTSTMSEVVMCIDDAKISLLGEDAWTLSNLTSSLEISHVVDKGHFIIETEPRRILLMPETESFIEVSVMANLVGCFAIEIPLKPTNPFTKMENVTIVVDVGGPRLHFESPEIDIGLVGVGMAEEKVFTFTNQGNVPAKFMFKASVDVDTDVHARGVGGRGEKGSSTNVSTARQSTHRDSSRQNSHRSDASGTSKDSFAVENPTAEMYVDPPAGLVGPQEQMVVTVKCKAGQFPQRVRGTLDCSVYDESGAVQLMSQMLSIRGEVQSPKTVLHPMSFDLGKVYVGMPVFFNVSLENICNLPTKFRFERPGGEAPSYRLSFEPSKGTLGAKEKVSIRCEFVALQSGVVDDVLACKIFGVQYPLGFTLAASAQGLQLEFANLFDGQSVPKPMGKPTDTQFPAGDDPPLPNPPQTLDFGQEVNLYERRTLRMTIRNFSAIPTPFNLAVRKFIVENNALSTVGAIVVKDDGSVDEDDDGRRKDLLIGPHEDGLNKYHSEAGKQYIGVRLGRREDLKYLTSQKGCAYSIEPSSGFLPAWGVQVITIRVFNDMPGCYDDELLCTAMDGGNIERQTIVPLTMNVLGCPLIIEKNSIGMSIIRTGKGNNWPESELGKMVLQLGNSCVDAPPIVREFRVLNNGAKRGKIKWKFKSPPTKTSIGEGSAALIGADRLDGLDAAPEDATLSFSKIPFTVEPKKAAIKPYQSQTFKVTMNNTSSPGWQSILLSAVVAFDEDPPPMEPLDGAEPVMASSMSVSSFGGGDDESVESTNSLDSLARRLKAQRNDNYKLTLLAEADLYFPAVRIDKKLLTATSNPTMLADGFALKMKAQAPLLFAKGTKPSDVCYRPVTIVNPQSGSLIFSVVTEGPFKIKYSADDESKPAGGSGGAGRTVAGTMELMSASEPSTKLHTSTSASVGKMFNLLSDASASFGIAFTPRRDLRDTMAVTTSAASGASKQAEQSGKLIVTFTTGQSLHVPLIAQISTPFITASSPRLFFGVCHVKQSCEGTMLLSNPTDVVARWTVTHVPGAGGGKRPSAIRVRGFEDTGPEVDDPSVFDISPNSGAVEGPTVSVAAAVAAPPKDFNRTHGEKIVVPQRLIETSWASNTLTLRDSIKKRHDGGSREEQSAADAVYPMPLVVTFRPKKNTKYSSRFRFECEYGNPFDVLLHGQGTYEEHEHRPLFPHPR